MTNVDLEGMPLMKLLSLRNAIDSVIAVRGHSQTASSLAGELIERTVATAYRGRLLKAGTKSVDVIARDGRRLQVKTRALLRGDNLRHWAFRDFNFDAAIVVAVDRETFTIDWARELSNDEVRTFAKPHITDSWRLRMHPVKGAGIDVTDHLRRAFQELP